jgi:hypothetical protein
MEEKDDLMKNIMDDNSKNLKKYLLMGGATFVIFVVGIVIAKFAFGDSKDNTQIILPPESSGANTKNQKEASDLFNSINVEKGESIGKKDIQTQKENSSEISLDNSDEFKKPEPLKNVNSVSIKEDVKQNVENLKEKVNQKAEAIQEKVKNSVEQVKKFANENVKNLKVVVKDKQQNIEEKKNVIRNYYI